MIRNTDGTMEEVPACQFVLNRKQQFMVIGVDFSTAGYTAESIPDVQVDIAGKLSDQSTIFQLQIKNSLVNSKWNFTKYPDPQIVIMTDNRVY